MNGMITTAADLHKCSSWLSIGGDDGSNASFVVKSLTSDEPNLCWECVVALWTRVSLQSESLDCKGGDLFSADTFVYLEIYDHFQTAPRAFANRKHAMNSLFLATMTQTL